MKKSIISKTAAALSVLITLSFPVNTFAAFVKNKAVVVGMSTGLDIISADTEFSDGLAGWEISGGQAEVTDGAVEITAEGNSGLSTNIGSGFYKSASAGAPSAWDFETDGDITTNLSLEEDSDTGKWAPARTSMPLYTESVDDVEPYNYQYAAEGGTNSNVISWQPGVTELIPAAGSKRCHPGSL